VRVIISNNKLRKSLETERDRTKTFGADMAKKIAMRISLLEEADSLADFWPPKSLPERCHELQGERKGTFSIDLKHPFRLLFIPVEEEQEGKEAESKQPVPEQQGADAELDRWRSIKTVDITSIEDTHG